MLLAIVTLIEGLHHDGKQDFSGRMSPALTKLRESMSSKMSQLRNFVSGNHQATTTVEPSQTHSTVKGDGDDILGQML